MTKRFVLTSVLFAFAFLALQPGPAMAIVATKPEAATLASKEFFKPEMHISSSNVELQQTLAALPNKGAWVQFAAKYGQPQVYLDPRSGAATSIVARIPMIPGAGVGNTLDLSKVGEALGRKVVAIDREVVGDLVRKFVTDNSAAIGVVPSQLGAPKAEKVTESLWNVRFPQIVHGIPVRYSQMVAVINGGNLVLLGTSTWGNAIVDPRPEVREDEVWGIAFSFVGGRKASDEIWQKPSLEIVPVAPQQFQAGEAFAGPIGLGYGYRLVWSFGFQRREEDGRFEVLVDAHTGEVVSFEDRNLYEAKKMTGGVYPLTDTEVCPSSDRCGQMFPDYPMPFADTGLAAPNDFSNSAGLFNYTSGTVTTHLAGKYVAINDTCGAVNETAAGDVLFGGVNGQHDCTASGASPGNTASSRSAFYEINKLKEMARGWLPANTWLQAQLNTNVNLNNTCNAFYSPTAGDVNFYRSGGGCRNTGEIAAVFDHEWGHGMDDNDSGGALSNSSEIYADITAVLRLQASCVGYGFWWTSDNGCGQTTDGTGFNGDESQTATHHCNLDCSGVRGADWDKHADHNPDTPSNFICVFCSTGSGPCGREVHCENAPGNQTAWDLATRDLEAAPFNMPRNDAFIAANKIFYQGSGLIGNWETCTCPSTSNGCGADNAYLQWLAADDDDGNLANGTPHMTAIFAAFNRHGIACATPTVQNSGCAGGPTTAPNLTVAVGTNSLNLSWSAVPGATSYRVLRSEGFGGCDFGKAVIAEVPGLSYTDLNVANGRAANYVVQAVGSSSACFGPSSACVTGVPQPCAGSVTLSRELYNCSGGPLNITVVDGDLTGAGTQAVSISSNTEHGPETLVLTENPAASGVFTGTFATTTNPPVLGDGAISISDGDTIAVDYLDVSFCGTPNVTVSKFATVDCSAPIISNVQITNITGNSADVTFTTNEPTSAVAQYGTTPPPSGTASNPTLTTAHTVHLANLTGCTAYVVAVQATDPTGNTASDNNGNAYYGFITLSNVTPTYAYTGPPVAIPDSTTVTATIAVPDVKLVQDVNVKVANLTHTYDGDLVLTLIAPNGVRVQLANKRGSGGDNYTNTVFDDEATTPIASGTPPFTGSFQPEVPLSAVDNIPANGNWTLEVQDTANVDTGTLTAWELQFTYPSEPCPTVGSVTLDKDVYRCSDSAQIHVVDFSIVGAGTQPVTIVSTTEGSGETVTLNETPANSGSFIGTIALTTAAPSTGDSLLSVANNDTITVTYIDADDGYGHLNVPRTDTATLDCAAPVITNVQAQNIIADQADITFTTDQPGNTTVYYGTTLPPTTPLSAAAFVTSHSTHLTGLAACTPYFYYVVSADPVGNSSTANNGGAYYSFTSDCTGPVITNIHTANFVGSSIDIDFDTNEPGNTTVYFGTTAPPTTPFTNAAFVTSHVTNVTGLAGCTQYFFYVVSADPVGNSTTDNNGGAYYSFSTDCTPPVITNVHTANLNGNSVDIVFDTNEPGNTTVFYGTTAPPATQASSAAFVTAHSLHVTGLTPCTAYYYYVTSADPLGNSATNNNNGVYYAFTTPVNNNPTYSYSGPPVAIPDNSPTGASVTINVTDVQQIVDLNVRVNITHTFDGDLTLSLTGPDSTTIILSNRRGSSGDNFTDTVFDQEAATAIASGTAPFTGSFIPDESLAGYAGKFATGIWTLKVVDSAAADTGNITGFDLFFTYPPQPCGQPVVHRRSHTVANACSVGGPGNGDAYADPGEALTIPVELLNTGTGAATGVVATLSSTNPNVTFTQASANYGNLAIAQSAFGSQPFVAQVGSNVACGTVIPIQIATVSNEGSWTDTISVQVGAPVFNSNTYTSTDVPKTISDNTIVTSNLTIANTGVIGDLNVQVSITHTWDGDLTLTLIGPNAQRVTLVNRRGSSGDNFTGTIFDDQAATAITAGTPPYTGSFRPEQPLSVFNGMAANGTWKLEVNDQAAGDTGTLTAWSIQVTTPGTYACNVCTLAAPGEATQLQFTAPDTLSWSSAPGASYYYLYRGVGSDLPNLLTGTVDSCQRAGTASLSMTSVGDTPTPSQLLWYLVRGWNTGGLGTPGNATAGPRVQDSSGTCP